MFHLFTVYHSKRKKIIDALRRKNINVRIVYPFPVHLMKGYKKVIGKKRFNLRKTERAYKGIFSLPLYPTLKIIDVQKIIKVLAKITEKV